VKEVLGVSPIACLTQWRMELAREALVDRHCNVTEVSEKVGYQSLPPFSRAFKRHFGVRPGEVRRGNSKERSRIVGCEASHPPRDQIIIVGERRFPSYWL